MMARSPINWLGGKSRLAQRILEAFPPASHYDVFAEVFCGSCAITLNKPRSHHLEAINDLNSNLMNFWMQVREEVEHLQWKLETLPYAETLFRIYKRSLDTNEPLDPVERAARWYYVKRCTIGAHIDSDKGWHYTAPRAKINYDVPSEGISYQNAVSTLAHITSRLQSVQIHTWDFARMIEKYQSPRTLFYVDPPYIGSEQYYEVDDTPPFTPEDHQRLAALLNTTSAQVVLSYYDCPELDEYYPYAKWRRLTWKTHKESSRMNASLQTGHEVLLMNYPAESTTLWNTEYSA